MIRLPFVQAVGRCQHWVPWSAYAKVRHLHRWQAKRTVRERLIAETFIDEALGMWKATPTAEERAARVRVAIDRITDLRRRGLPWCAVARELRK